MGYTLVYLSLIVLDPARDARDQDRAAVVERAVGARDEPARDRVVQDHVRHLVPRRAGQRRVRDAARVGARPLQVLGQAACSTRSSTFRSRCRPRCRASRSRRCSRRTAGSAASSSRSASSAVFSPLGIMLALMFIALPFVVRTVQPVLEELEPEVEEAAAVARRDALRRRCARVILPALVAGDGHRASRSRSRARSASTARSSSSRATSSTRPRSRRYLIMTRLERVRLRECHRARARDARRLVRDAARDQRLQRVDPPARRERSPDADARAARRPRATRPPSPRGRAAS